MKAYVLFSSSNGNCTYIKNGKEEILIDVGLSAKKISDALIKLGTNLSNITSIFITHEHIDHIKALNVICRHYRIPIYIPAKSLDFVATSMQWTEELLVENSGGAVREFDGLKITAFDTPHDSLGSVCFRIEAEDTTLGYATDIGHLTSDVKKSLTGCESVVIESNYDPYMLKNGTYPYATKQRILGDRGHLSNGECAAFLPELYKNGTRNFVLAHLSQNNNKPHIALSESRGALGANGICVCDTFGKADARLCAAMPDSIVEII